MRLGASFLCLLVMVGELDAAVLLSDCSANDLSSAMNRLCSALLNIYRSLVSRFHILAFPFR